MFSNKCLSLLVLLFPAAIVTLSAQPFAPNTSASERPVTSRDLVFNPALKPFYHGVASGDPTTNSVVIWTRVTPDVDGPVVVTYSMATDTAFQNMVTSGTVLSDIDRDNTVKITVPNLSTGALTTIISGPKA